MTVAVATADDRLDMAFSSSSCVGEGDVGENPFDLATGNSRVDDELWSANVPTKSTSNPTSWSDPDGVLRGCSRRMLWRKLCLSIRAILCDNKSGQI